MPYFLLLSRDAQQQLGRVLSFWTQPTMLNSKIQLLLFLHQPPFAGRWLLFAASLLVHSPTFHSSCVSWFLIPPSSLQLFSYTVAPSFLHLCRTPCLATSTSNAQHQYLLEQYFDLSLHAHVHTPIM